MMDESQAILFLLDLGQGSKQRDNSIEELVEELQELCNVTDDRIHELREQLKKSESVSTEPDGAPVARPIM